MNSFTPAFKENDMPDANLQKLLDHLNSGECVPAGSELHELMHYYATEARKITAAFNHHFCEEEEIRAIMARLTGRPIDASFKLFPPFYSDFGKNIHIGKNVFINCCCCFQDQGGIYIDDGCLIGHQVVIATINHELNPAQRASHTFKPVRIGKNVWIGSGAKIMPGVNIGKNAVIAAGAVVTKDVPTNVVTAGVPARIIREISQDKPAPATYLA